MTRCTGEYVEMHCENSDDSFTQFIRLSVFLHAYNSRKTAGCKHASI